MSQDLDLKKEAYPLYHGFRTKTPISDIDALITFSNGEAYTEIVKALKHFSFGYLVEAKRTDRASAVNLVHGMVNESQRKRRFGFIYTCPHRDRMERWAIRNPEIIFLTLDYAGVPLEKTLDYLTHQFGNPHIAKLRKNIVSRFPQAVVPIKDEIKADDIEWIRAVEGNQIDWLRRI